MVALNKSQFRSRDCHGFVSSVFSMTDGWGPVAPVMAHFLFDAELVDLACVKSVVGGAVGKFADYLALAESKSENQLKTLLFNFCQVACTNALGI